METVSSKPILKGEYKLLKVLQKLPYSTYYLGTSLHNPGNRWAIKEIILDFDNPDERIESLNFFEKIAKKYTKINHPLLVPLADYFYERDFEYIIFEFIPGHRLQEILDLRKKPFTESQVIDFARQVASALECLHSLQICFHDLNPSNIIITPEGTIKLTDYGLGKILARRDNTHPKWGTKGYAPPEQYGEDAILNEAVDLFALGVIMHQMLTFWDPTVSRGIYPMVRKLNSEASEELEKLISKAVQMGATLRYSTAREFVKDLDHLTSIRGKAEPEEETWLVKIARELSKPFRKQK